MLDNGRGVYTSSLPLEQLADQVEPLRKQVAELEAEVERLKERLDNAHGAAKKLIAEHTERQRERDEAREDTRRIDEVERVIRSEYQAALVFLLENDGNISIEQEDALQISSGPTLRAAIDKVRDA